MAKARARAALRPAPSPRGTRERWMALAAVLVTGALALGSLRHSAYIQDDHLAIESNPIVARGDLGEILSTDYWAGAKGSDEGLYRPTTIASYAWEVAWMGRPDPRVSHAINIALHLAVSCVLLLLALRLGMGLFGATLAALLFALHPQHVEPVANVVGRAELLAALGALAGTLLWTWTGPWAGERPSSGHARAAAWGVAALLLFGMGAKEVAVVTLAWLVLVDLLWRRPAPGQGRAWLLDRAAALAPSLLALELYLILRVRALRAFPGVQHVHPTDNPLLLLAEPERTATALSLLARYFRSFLWPQGLAIDVSGPVLPPEQGLLAPRALAGLLLLLLAAAAIAWPFLAPAARRGPLARVGAVAAAVFLLPYLVISNLVVPVGVIFADRLFYLPSAGLCLAVGALCARASVTAGLPDLGPHRRLLAGSALVLAIMAGVASWRRTQVWRDDGTIFADALSVHPDSPRSHYILGKLAADEGRDQEAIAAFDRAIAVWPSYTAAYQEKGVVLGRGGRDAEAEEAFRETLRQSPGYDAAHYNLGLVLRRRGRLADAERELRKALLLDPGYARAWAELGHLRAEQGRRAEAADAYRRAIALGRTDLRPRLLAVSP